MTEIVVAQRSGVLRAPDGTQYRLTRGQTLADGRHPAVTSSPASWRPVQIELAVDDSAALDRGDEIAELEETVERHRGTLFAIRELLDGRGLLAGVDTGAEGWLVARLAELLPPGAPADVAEPTRTAASPAAELADPETPEGRAAIREWAWAHGHSVSDRGALPKVIVEQYRAAHAG